MAYQEKESFNKDKLDYLSMVLKENSVKNNKDLKLFYSIISHRFGSKMPVVHKEAATVDIIAQIEDYSKRFHPEILQIEIFTAKSRNVKKPIAVIKLYYKDQRGTA